MSNLSYVSAPQANIYFGGILIDECYDIQYSYRESKEPIYGYLSKHFDAIIPGTVIITGALTINYKHDQYLSKVLEKASSPVGHQRLKNSRPNTLAKYQQDYKNMLVQYANALKQEAQLKQELAELKKKRSDAVNSYDDIRNFYEEEISEIQARIDQILEDQANSESGVPPEEMTEYIILQGELEDVKAEEARYLNTPENTSEVDNSNNLVEEKEKELTDLNLSAIRDKVNELKNKMSTLMVTADDLPLLANEQTSESLSSVRAEDYRDGFTIEFNYNGSPHKRIVGCELLGHGHVITQSGMPVKEQYTFIAKRME